MWNNGWENKMSEERLKEIKDSIDLQYEMAKRFDMENDVKVLIDEELELYNEVIRLREIIDKANKFIETNYFITGRIKDLSDILKENNNDNK